MKLAVPRTSRSLLSIAAVLAVAVALLVSGRIPTQAAAAANDQAKAAKQLPCDIYGASGSPCVAAYSTVRALYAGYAGPLYEVTRASDQRTLDIRPQQKGGIADAAPQDRFCRATTCTITEVYDQSPEHNDLGVAPGGGENPVPDDPADASALPVTVGGHHVYGLKIEPGQGYRDDTTRGIAANGQPESMYMVTSANNVDGGCCFDFGNAETNDDDNGNGHMDALNFSTRCVRFSPCYGSGPWVQVDLENGLFQSNMGYSQNTLNTGTDNPFVTALTQDNGQNFFSLKEGNAQSGSLTTNYAGLLPTIQGGGYSPMQQEGAIVLGPGGDNSNKGSGEFFEGVMTAAVTSDTADEAVQANIVAARYAEQ